MADSRPTSSLTHDSMAKILSALHVELNARFIRLSIKAPRRNVIVIRGPAVAAGLPPGDEAELAAAEGVVLGEMVSEARDLPSGYPVFVEPIAPWGHQVRLALSVVDPEVDPSDLLRRDRFGELIPWALLHVSASPDMARFRQEAVASLSSQAFLFAICEWLAADSALLWLLHASQGRNRDRFKAAASWGLRSPGRSFEVPRGKGLVGQLTAVSGPVIANLAGDSDVRPYNPQAIKAEGWQSCAAFPIIAGGHLIGALSLYSRQYHQNLARVRDIDPAILLGAGVILSHLRKEAEKQEWDRLVAERLERLQSGVELLGFAHDLAASASKTAARAHELVTSLSPIQLPSEAPPMLAELTQQADVTAQITRSMNRLAGGRRPELTRFDLRDAVTQIQPILQSMTSGLTIAVPAGLELRGDDLDIQRIVINLVANARHWTNVENRDIGVTARVVGSAVELSVSDNGVGIDTADQLKATELFFSRRQGGLGLGLFVVNLLARRLGGQLRIRSKKFEGTIVTVVIPSAAQRKKRTGT